MPLRDPVARKAYKDAYYAANRQKVLTVAAKGRKAWQERDPWRKARTAWYASRKAARKRGIPVGTVTMYDIARLHELPCTYCGTVPSGGADHSVALSRGGTNDLENLVPCCLPCNQHKSFLGHDLFATTRITPTIAVAQK